MESLITPVAQFIRITSWRQIRPGQCQSDPSCDLDWPPDLIARWLACGEGKDISPLIDFPNRPGTPNTASNLNGESDIWKLGSPLERTELGLSCGAFGDSVDEVQAHSIYAVKREVVKEGPCNYLIVSNGPILEVISATFSHMHERSSFMHLVYFPVRNWRM